jgi:hypothetical protein
MQHCCIIFIHQECPNEVLFLIAVTATSWSEFRAAAMLASAGALEGGKPHMR